MIQRRHSCVPNICSPTGALQTVFAHKAEPVFLENNIFLVRARPRARTRGSPEGCAHPVRNAASAIQPSARERKMRAAEMPKQPRFVPRWLLQQVGRTYNAAGVHLPAENGRARGRGGGGDRGTLPPRNYARDEQRCATGLRS